MNGSASEAPTQPATTAPPAEDDEPQERMVAAPFRNRIVFAREPLDAYARNADTAAIETWTLGEPLHAWAYGPAPYTAVLFADVNGEPAVGTGAEIVSGGDVGGVANFLVSGDGKGLPRQVDLSPQLAAKHLGSAVTQHAGVWAKEPPGWARFWQELHTRLVPMMHVGDNTVKLVLADSDRKQIYAEGTLTVRIPDEAALKSELAANTEPAAEGNAANLREIDALIRKHEMFAGLEIVRIAYATGRLEWQYDDATQSSSRTVAVELIHRKKGDPFPARCRLVGVIAKRPLGASGKPGKFELDGKTLEVRWTPCPARPR